MSIRECAGGFVRLRFSFFLITLFALPLVSIAEEDFALKDGDTVVFLGDSITAARTYSKLIENYTLLRYPNRHIRFYNAGIGGDTAAGALKRLDRDVFSRGATVLTVCFGLNDIGWGLHADDEHKTLYLNSLRAMIEECQKRDVRVFICSSPVTAEDPDKSEAGYLQGMCDEAFAMAKEKGANTIDVQRLMRHIQRRILAANKSLADETKHTKLHSADGVHLNDLGQLAMAYAFLKGFHAASEVSRAEIDLASANAKAVSGCRISDIQVRNDGCEFTRLDEGLPFNYGLFYALNFAYVPLPKDMNGYWLKVTGLEEGQYEVTVDGRSVAKFAANQLASGVDLASRTTDAWQPGGPWDVQASLLRSLTDARHEIDSVRFVSRLYLPGHSLVEELDEKSVPTEERIIELQRLIAQPRSYRFIIHRVKDENLEENR